MSSNNNSEIKPLISIPKKTKERRAFWKEEVTRWQASGLSQRLYSQKRGLVEGRLSYWVNQFKDNLLSSVVPKESFVPIKIHQESQPSCIRIKRPDGLYIELSIFPDKEQLKMLLEVLTC